METEHKARRSILAPEARNFRQMDDSGKLAAWRDLFRMFQNELDELSRGHVTRLDDLKRMHKHVEDAKRVLEILQLQIKICRDSKRDRS
jgi:hypothetical protein